MTEDKPISRREGTQYLLEIGLGLFTGKKLAEVTGRSLNVGEGNYTSQDFSSREYEVRHVDDTWFSNPNLDENEVNQYQVEFRKTGDVADLLIEKTGRQNPNDRWDDRYNVTVRTSNEVVEKNVTRRELRFEVDKTLTDFNSVTSPLEYIPEDLAVGLATGVAFGGVIANGVLIRNQKVGRREFLAGVAAGIGGAIAGTLSTYTNATLDNRGRVPSSLEDRK
jgi:hypothetical protein